MRKVRFPAIPSLRWRLVIVMVLADLLVAVTTGIVTFSAQESGLQHQLEARASDSARILAAGAAATLQYSASKRPQVLKDLVNTVRGVGPRNDQIGYAAVLNDSGQVLASSASGSGRLPCPVPLPHDTRRLSNGDICAVAIIGTEFQQIGYAEVTAKGANAHQDLVQSTITSALVRAIGLLIFFLLSLAIAQNLVGPFEALAAAAASLGGGDLTTRVPADGTRELTALAQAFNAMASTLEQRIKQLSFLASAGSTLPNTFRHHGDVRPIIAQFCDQMGACAAGLIPTTDGESEGEDLWYETENAGEGCRETAVAALSNLQAAGAHVDGERALMTVPVLGDAIFVAVRAGGPPFTREEQQVIINFAYQLGIAADNARLFQSQQEALQVKDQFLSIVSHELRTPLTTIKGYSQMLRKRMEGRETDQRYAAHIDAQVSRLTRLVDDLLDVTRFARGQFELTLSPANLGPLLSDTVARFRIVAPKHTFRLEMAPGEYTGDWDYDRLEQVLNNLMSNAVKYSPDGGEVVVTARQEGSEVVVSVRDQGIGIEPDRQAHLFERFYRVAEDSDIKGLGLGLYVTRRIVEAHGGRIGLRSTPGDGSEFWFTLPLTSSTGTTSNPARASRA